MIIQTCLNSWNGISEPSQKFICVRVCNVPVSIYGIGVSVCVCVCVSVSVCVCVCVCVGVCVREREINLVVLRGAAHEGLQDRD